MTTCSQKLESMYPDTKGPPCVRIKKCRSVCELSGFCLKLGKIGCQFCHNARGIIMTTMVFFCLISIIMIILSLIGMSENYTQLKMFAWSIGKIKALNNEQQEIGSADIYIGINAVAYNIIYNDTQIVQKWDQVQCEGKLNCVSCKDAAQSTYIPAIMALVTSLPTLTTDIIRANIKRRINDLNCQKFSGITNIIGSVTIFMTLGNYAQGCHRTLPTQVEIAPGITGETEWSRGPGFILISIASFFKILDLLVHISLPTPKEKNNKKQFEQQDSENKLLE